LKNQGKTLTELLKKLEVIRELNTIFAQNVDKTLAKHCVVTAIQNGCVIVLLDSGNWATQLRFHIPDLLTKLREHSLFRHIKSICCKTRPIHQNERLNRKKKKSPMKKLSLKVSKEVEESAKLISDEKLRKIMLKIASRKT